MMSGHVEEGREQRPIQSDSRLELALVNAMAEAKSETSNTNVAASVVVTRGLRERSASAIKGVVKRALRPIFHRLRNYLMSPSLSQLENLQASVNALQRKVLSQLGGLQASMNTLQRQLDALANRFALPLNDEIVLVRTRYGYLYCSAKDDSLIVDLSEAGEFEPGVGRLLDRLLDPDGLFVDIGANVGAHAIHAARLVGEKGQVWAFEPTPETFSLLQRSLVLNGLSQRVVAQQIALGAAIGTVEFQVSLRTGLNSIFPDVRSSVLSVPMRRLDDMVPAKRPIDVVKISVHGGELDVLRGMSAVIAANPHGVLIVEYGSSGLERAGVEAGQWLGAFGALGYEGFVVEEPSGKMFPLLRSDLGRVRSINVAFVRRDSPKRVKMFRW